MPQRKPPKSPSTMKRLSYADAKAFEKRVMADPAMKAMAEAHAKRVAAEIHARNKDIRDAILREAEQRKKRFGFQKKGTSVDRLGTRAVRRPAD